FALAAFIRPRGAGSMRAAYFALWHSHCRLPRVRPSGRLVAGILSGGAAGARGGGALWNPPPPLARSPPASSRACATGAGAGGRSGAGGGAASPPSCWGMVPLSPLTRLAASRLGTLSPLRGERETRGARLHLPRISHGAGAGVGGGVACELAVELAQQHDAVGEAIFDAGGGERRILRRRRAVDDEGPPRKRLGNGRQRG